MKIHKTVIFASWADGCETWSLTSREEHPLPQYAFMA